MRYKHSTTRREICVCVVGGEEEGRRRERRGRGEEEGQEEGQEEGGGAESSVKVKKGASS